MFSSLKTSGVPGENYTNFRSTHTYGTTPATKRSRFHKTPDDTESVIELAEDRDFEAGSSNAYAMHTNLPRPPNIETLTGIYVRNSLTVDFQRI